MQVDLYVVDRTGARIAPLPDARVDEMTWVLNEPGNMSFNINPLAAGASAIDGIRREIQVWIDDDLMWWGVPWSFIGNSTEIKIQCEGLLSLFTKRFIDRMSMVYASIDQLSIAWDLLNYAQSEAVEADRDFLIDSAAFGSSGVPRSREFLRDEHKMILDCLKEFDSRTLKNGFDWEIAITGDGGRFWTPYYPKKGANKGNYGMEWIVGQNIQRGLSGFTWAKNFGNLATLVYVTGGSVTTESTSIKKEGKYEDTSVDGSPYWGQMQSIVSDGSQLDQDWLDDRAEREVLTRKVPTINADLTSVISEEFDVLRNVNTGDWFPVRIEHGMVQINDWRRVYEKKFNPGTMTTELVLGEVVAVP